MKDKQPIGIEELLANLRHQKGYTYLEVATKLNDRSITEKTVKKWEKGLIYPDLTIIYQLSELYLVSSEEFLQAKQASFSQGFNSIHVEAIKWICYFLDITVKATTVMTYTILFLLLLVSFLAFTFLCSQVNKSML